MKSETKKLLENNIQRHIFRTWERSLKSQKALNIEGKNGYVGLYKIFKFCFSKDTSRRKIIKPRVRRYLHYIYVFITEKRLLPSYIKYSYKLIRKRQTIPFLKKIHRRCEQIYNEGIQVVN